MRSAISDRAASSASTERSLDRRVASAAARLASASRVSVRFTSRFSREMTSRWLRVSARACSLRASASRACVSSTCAAATPTAASALATAASARASWARSSAVSMMANTSPAFTRSPSRTRTSATRPASFGDMSIKSASILPLPREKPSGGTSDGRKSTVHAPNPRSPARRTTMMMMRRDIACFSGRMQMRGSGAGKGHGGGVPP